MRSLLLLLLLPGIPSVQAAVELRIGAFNVQVYVFSRASLRIAISSSFAPPHLVLSDLAKALWAKPTKLPR
jgi:hypothetical protein